MAKTSTAMEVGQEGSLREGLEAAIRERVREIIEMVLQEEVEATLGAPRSQRVAERAGYRHGSKPRRLTLRTGTVQLDVPRARLAEADGGEREWQSQLVPRYRRSSREVEQSVLGVSAAAPGPRESVACWTPTDEIVERILAEVSEFANGEPQHDDVTLVVMKVQEGCEIWGS